MVRASFDHGDSHLGLVPPGRRKLSSTTEVRFSGISQSPKLKHSSSMSTKRRLPSSPTPFVPNSTLVPSRYRDEEIVEVLCDQFLPPSTPNQRYCVDVGARSGLGGDDPSISHHLIVTNTDNRRPLHAGHRQKEQAKWFGILIQPDSGYYKKLRQLHDGERNKASTASAKCLQVTPSAEEGLNERSLVWILGQFAGFLPLNFDVLCFVDGTRCNHYWILRDFLECRTYQPQLIAIPYDGSSFSGNASHVPLRSDRYGVACLRALIEMTAEYNYQLVMTTKKCAFFVTDKLFQEHLRASIRKDASEIAAMEIANQRRTQRLEDSRDQTPLNKRSVPQKQRRHVQRHPPSPVGKRREDTDTAIIVGIQCLTERREQLEQTRADYYQKKSQDFRANLTPAWQKRKMSIIDSLQSKNVQRRRAIRHSLSVDKLSGREDPPDTMDIDTGGKQMKIGIVKKKEPKETARVLGESEQQSSRRHPPDPPGEVQIELQRNAPSLDLVRSNSETERGEKTDSIISSCAVESSDLLGEGGELISSQGTSEFPNFNENEILESQHIAMMTLGDMEEEIVFSTDEELPENVTTCLNDDVPFGETAINFGCCFLDQNGRDGQGRKIVARSLTAALQRNGWALVRGTGISRFVCHDALMASHLILQGADESARESCKASPRSFRGYSPLCTEQSGETDLKDMVRKYRVGSAEIDDPPNVWPKPGHLDENTNEYIRASLQNYYDEIDSLAVELMECIHESVSFDSSSCSYASKRQNESGLLSAWSCSKGSRHALNKPIVAPHKDPCLLSILLIDGGDCATFQHENASGIWENTALPVVLSDDPVFFVNVGDELSHHTRGLFPAISRRLIPACGTESLNALLFSLFAEANAGTCPSPVLLENYDDEESEGEIRRTTISLSRLAAELEAVDRAFRSDHQWDEQSYEEAIENALKVPSGLINADSSEYPITTQGRHQNLALQKSMCAQRVDSKTQSIPTNEFRCSPASPRFRLQSDGSDGIPSLQSLERWSRRAEMSKPYNPFRIVREKLFSKYGVKQAKDNDDTASYSKRERTSESRSMALSKLLPPQYVCRFPLGVSPPERKQQTNGTVEIKMYDRNSGPGCTGVNSCIAEASDEYMEQNPKIPEKLGILPLVDLNSNEFRPGSPGRPIVIDEDSFGAPSGILPSSLPSDRKFFFKGLRPPASYSNSPIALSEHLFENTICHKSTTLPTDTLRKTDCGTRTRLGHGVYKANISQKQNTLEDCSRQTRDVRDPPVLHQHRATGSQELCVREKRKHFLQLQSHLEGGWSGGGSLPEVDKRISGGNLGNDDIHSHLSQTSHFQNHKPKTPTMLLHDTLDDSVLSSAIESVEASDVLDELLSEGVHHDSRGNTNENLLLDTEGINGDAMPRHVAPTVTTPPDSQYSRIMRYNDTFEVIDSNLYNQTITFPQLKENLQTGRNLQIPLLTKETPTPIQSSVNNDDELLKSNSAVSQLWPQPEEQITPTNDEAMSKPEGFIYHYKQDEHLAQTRQWKATQLPPTQKGVASSVEGERASVSIISDITDEAFKIGCPSSFGWMT